MNSPAVVDVEALGWLGRVVCKIRPQWDAAGVRSALESALTEHGYPATAEMFVHTARDPTAQTPRAAYERLKRGYSANPGDVPPKTPNNATLDGRCRKCGLWVVRGEQHECARIADPATGASKAKAALADARRATTEKETSHG